MRCFMICTVCLIASTNIFAEPIPKKPAIRPKLLWTIKPDPTISSIPNTKYSFNAMMADSERVYVGCENGWMEAYTVKDQKLVWRYETGKRIYHGLALCGDIVIVGNESGYFALNKTDGKLKWRIELKMDGGSADPIAVDEENQRLFCGGSDGKFRCLDARNGKEIWTSDLLYDRPKDPPGFDGKVARFQLPARIQGCTYRNGAVYINVMDQCRCIVLSAKDGKRKWAFQTKGWVDGAATVDDENCFIGSQDKSFYCFNVKTGKLNWSRELKSEVRSEFVQYNGTFYAATYSQAIFKFTPSSIHSELVAQDPKQPGKQRTFLSAPVAYRNALFFFQGRELVGINMDTNQKNWSIKLQSTTDYFYIQPNLMHNKLYALDSETGLICFSLE